MRITLKSKSLGLHAFRAVHTFKAVTKTDLADRRNPPHHEKCRADGETHSVNANVRKSASKPYGHGTWNLVMHLATEYPEPD